MPALTPTEFTCEIVYIGRVLDREADLSSQSLGTANLTFGGISGEAHNGVTRASCSRVIAQHPRGTEIANVRQLSIVSEEELELIAKAMGIDGLDPRWLGASLMVRGLPDFTHVPPSARLQASSGATIVVDMENRSCHLPAKVIDRYLPEKGKLFKGAASNRRGVTAWVERPGVVSVGDSLTLHIPDQPTWSHF